MQGSSGRPPLLVFAATNDPPTQEAVRRDAEAAGALVTVADDRARSRFLVPATFRQGDLTVAISTSGASPALARRLRREVQVALGHEYRGYVRFLRAARKQIAKTIPSQAQRAQVFRRLRDGLALDWFQAAGPGRARKEIGNFLRKLGAKTRT